MLNLTLDIGSGEQVWLSPRAPDCIRELKSPPILIRSATLTGELRQRRLDQCLKDLSVQSMAHHARSCYLGSDDSGFHYFAKGIGWCLSPGWSPARGNTGILPGWAARRERDISQALANQGQAVAEPMAIFKYDWVPAVNACERWPANKVLDLDGTMAEPSLYIYRHKARFRMADLPSIAPEKISLIRENYYSMLTTLRDSICTIHALGGHDYSLSMHNVWEDGARVDFEYVVLASHPHPVHELNKSLEDWQAKEWQAFRCLAFEIADMVSLEADATCIDSICSPP